MRSLKYTTVELRPLLFVVCAFLCLAVRAEPSAAQSVAFLAPEKTGPAAAYAERLTGSFPAAVKTLDISMAASAYDAVAAAQPFNMSAAEAMTAGSSIGCDFLIIIKAAVLRRTSFEKPEYYEAFAASFVVRSSDGQLVHFHLARTEASTPAAAEAALLNSAPAAADEIRPQIDAAAKYRPPAAAAPIAELPREGTPESVGFRPPVPYRRIKPEYTSIAGRFDIAATVDVEMDLAADGTILKADVVRWAGFGLDGSALAAVRSMKWRPAEHSGRTLPVRVLLRYNFKKTEK